MKRKILITLMLLLAIFTTSGCGKKEPKYMMVNEITPQYLFDHTAKEYQDFAKKHWDEMVSAVNEYTLTNFNFRSTISMYYTSWETYNYMCHIVAKSLDHENFYFPAPVRIDLVNDKVEFPEPSKEGVINSFGSYMYGYLITYYYQDALEALNDATDEFIQNKNLKDLSPEYLACMGEGYNNFSIKHFQSTPENNQLANSYFINTKYEDYNKDDMAPFIVDSYIPAEGEHPQGKDGKTAEELVRVIFVNENQLDGTILQEYLEFIKNKEINLPPFVFRIETTYELAYITEPISNDISTLRFDNRYNIIQEFTSEISADNARKRASGQDN